MTDKAMNVGTPGHIDHGTSAGASELKAMLERIAALEHDQWAHWTRYMLDNMTPDNVSRWRAQVETPYSNLSESEKEADRKWARIVLDVLRSNAKLPGGPSGTSG